MNPDDRLDPTHAGGRGIIGPTTREVEILTLDYDTLRKVPDSCRTLVFDITETTAAPVNSDHRPQVRVTWGSAKGRNLAAFDLVKGCSIPIEGASSVVASASMGGFNIDSMFSWDNGLLPTASPIYNVRCSIGKSGGKPATNTFTDFLRVLAGAAEVEVPIPKYAAQVELHHNGDPFARIPPDVSMGFLSWSAAGIPVRTMTGLRDAPISIPSGSEAIRLGNLSAGNLNIQLVYRLAV
jgi:hypothetical protein